MGETPKKVPGCAIIEDLEVMGVVEEDTKGINKWQTSTRCGDA